MVAISVDPASESKKTASLLDGAFPLVSDPTLQAIRAYGMEHSMGGEVVGNMGYVIIDRQGIVQKIAIDPSFGQRASAIIETLGAM